jgi:hypothetical protein
MMTALLITKRPTRAYVTAAGMAFGLVAVWAALVPLFGRR